MRTRYWSLGVVLGGLIVTTTALAAFDCNRRPTCEEMGYTDMVGDCGDGDMVKCPFDQTKGFCRQSAMECRVGDILYSDLKCYDETPIGLAAIGVVFDTTNRLAISLEVKEVTWRLSSHPEDVPSLQNCTLENVVVDCDTDGKANTETIVAYYGDSADYAAGYCHNYTTEGTKKGDWFLPSMKELMVLGDFIFPINVTLQSFVGSVYGRKYLNDKYYSSNEADTENNTFSLYVGLGTSVSAQYVRKYHQFVNYVADTVCVIKY